jgi:hypothetical protein
MRRLCSQPAVVLTAASPACCAVPCCAALCHAVLRCAGFLATVFDVFRSNQVSVDVVATSEVSISLSLDPKKCWHDGEVGSEHIDASCLQLHASGLYLLCALYTVACTLHCLFLSPPPSLSLHFYHHPRLCTLFLPVRLADW